MSKPGAIKSSPCHNCGAILTWSGNRGRPRKYCDYKCRDVVYGRRASREGTRKKLSAADVKTNRARYQKGRRSEQRAAIHQAKLERGACCDCGMVITDRTAIVIEWDHRFPAEKAFTIAYEIGRKPIEELLAEIAKCDAVCANCHRYRTHDNEHYLTTPRETQPEPDLFT